MRRASLIVALSFLIATASDGARRRAVVRPAIPPAIESVAPSSGPISGGTEVVLRGVALTSVRVTIDGAALAPRLQSNDRIMFIAPPHLNGYATIAVANAAGRSTAEFLYVPPALSTLPPGNVTTVVGIGQYIAEGRPAKQAPIYAPDFAVASDGTAYLAENNSNVVRRILPNGTIERFAGGGTPIASFSGDGGPALNAGLAYPNDVEIGPNGAIYICDSFNHRIRRIDAHTNIITTVAGSGPNANCCGGGYGGDGGPAVEAKLNAPTQIAFDPGGNLYIDDGYNGRIRRVSADGIITTVAGTGVRGFSGDGGPATSAQIDTGVGGDEGAMKIDRAGNIYFLDAGGRVRRVDGTTGIIQTVVGGAPPRTDDGIPASQALVSNGIALDADGRLFFTDPFQIRRLDVDGRVRTVIGSPDPDAQRFSDDGTPLSQTFVTNPARMEIDGRGNIYFLEFLYLRLRRADADTRTIQTIAGIAPTEFGEEGPGAAAQIQLPGALGLLNRELIFGHKYTYVMRLRTDGTLQRIGGSQFQAGPTQANVPRNAGRGWLPVAGLAIDANRNIYLADREVGKLALEGIYTRLTGSGPGFAGDGGPASEAHIDNAAGLALDSNGNIIVADSFNHRIRRIDAATGVINTIAGNGPPHPPNVLVPETSSGDGGPAKDAHVNNPMSVATDAQNRVYVADTDRIRRIDSDGIIRTVLPSCFGVLWSNRHGEVFVACNGQIRRIDGVNQWTVLLQLAFGPTSGDGGRVSEATGSIGNFAIDDDGTIYFSDMPGERIRAVKGGGQ